mgnify:CR=1 FL=1
MKTRLEYLKELNNRLNYVSSFSFQNEYFWVPPVNSEVNLQVFENGKSVQREFVVTRIITEYEVFPGEEKKTIISVVVKQLGLDPMGDSDE